MYSKVGATLKLDAPLSSRFLCAGERFDSDPSLGYSCSGFLVGPDLIATAGHCMVNTGENHNETETYCKVYSWLFDYQIDAGGKANVDTIPAEHLYQCKQVIYAVREEGAPYRDYALVQLDRPVANREPLLLADPTTRPIKTPLSMIGYPFGTPAKLSSGAEILLDDLARTSFITNLTAFEGNSGSAVFDSSNEVVGILIGGTPSSSLVEDDVKKCQRYNRCDETGSHCTEVDKDTSVFPGFQRTGSEVQRIEPIIRLIKHFRFMS
jgi:V8-like Glu-specific endopeptidase